MKFRFLSPLCRISHTSIQFYDIFPMCVHIKGPFCPLMIFCSNCKIQSLIAFQVYLVSYLVGSVSLKVSNRGVGVRY